MFAPNRVNKSLLPSVESSRTRGADPALEMTPADWAMLSRFSIGEWISHAQMTRLEALGLVEMVFGQAILTRAGRMTIGLDG